VMGTAPRGGGTDHRWLDALERDLVSKGLGRAAAAAEECRAALPDIARMVLRMRRAQWPQLSRKIRGLMVRGGVMVRGSGGVGPATFEILLAERQAPSPRLPWLYLTDPVEMLVKLEADIVATRGAEPAWQALRAFGERLVAASPEPVPGRARQVTLWKAATMAYTLDRLRYGEGDWVRVGRKLKEHGWFPNVTEEHLAKYWGEGATNGVQAVVAATEAHSGGPAQGEVEPETAPSRASAPCREGRAPRGPMSFFPLQR